MSDHSDFSFLHNSDADDDGRGFTASSIPPVYAVTGFPGRDRDEDEAASEAHVLAAAQAILMICHNALADLSARAYIANPNSHVVDGIDEAAEAIGGDVAAALALSFSRRVEIV